MTSIAASITALLATALLVSACQQDRLIGEERASTEGGGGGAGGKGPIDMTSSVSTVTLSGGGAGPIGCAGAAPDARPALAVLGSQISPNKDPDTLFLQFGDVTPTCADPLPHAPCGKHWGMSIGVPPAAQHLGVLALKDADPNSVFVESGPGNDCPGGGGSLIDGAIEIVCLAEAGLIFRLSGADPLTLAGVDPNGEYVAARCP